MLIAKGELQSVSRPWHPSFFVDGEFNPMLVASSKSLFRLCVCVLNAALHETIREGRIVLEMVSHIHTVIIIGFME